MWEQCQFGWKWSGIETTILGVVPMRSPHWGQVDLSRIWECQECRDYICRPKTQTRRTKGVVNISASGLANCSRGVGGIGRQKDEYSEFLLPGCHWGISYLSGISPFCLTWGVRIAKCDKGRLAGHQSWIVQICYLTPNTFSFNNHHKCHQVIISMNIVIIRAIVNTIK